MIKNLKIRNFDQRSLWKLTGHFMIAVIFVRKVFVIKNHQIWEKDQDIVEEFTRQNFTTNTLCKFEPIATRCDANQIRIDSISCSHALQLL